MNTLYKNIQFAQKELAYDVSNDADITDEMIVNWLAAHNRQISHKPITLEMIQQARKYRIETFSYETKVAGTKESETSIIDMIASDEDMEDDIAHSISSQQSFNAILAMIEDERKRAIIEEWYSSEEHPLVTLSNISRRHCITPERTKQLKADAEAELKMKLLAKGYRG